MNCPKCGAETDGGAAKCFYCGTNLRPAAVVPSGTSAPTSTPRATESAERVRTHGGAVWALVIGILLLAWSCLSFLSSGLIMFEVLIGPIQALTGLISIAAAVVGGVSARRIAISGGRLKGKAMAVFGLVVGIVASAICVVATLAYVASYH